MEIINVGQPEVLFPAVLLPGRCLEVVRQGLLPHVGDHRQQGGHRVLPQVGQLGAGGGARDRGDGLEVLPEEDAELGREDEADVGAVL